MKDESGRRRVDEWTGDEVDGAHKGSVDVVSVELGKWRWRKEWKRE